MNFPSLNRRLDWRDWPCGMECRIHLDRHVQLPTNYRLSNQIILIYVSWIFVEAKAFCNEAIGILKPMYTYQYIYWHTVVISSLILMIPKNITHPLNPGFTLSAFQKHLHIKPEVPTPAPYPKQPLALYLGKGNEKHVKWIPPPGSNGPTWSLDFLGTEIRNVPAQLWQKLTSLDMMLWTNIDGYQRLSVSKVVLRFQTVSLGCHHVSSPYLIPI